MTWEDVWQQACVGGTAMQQMQNLPPQFPQGLVQNVWQMQAPQQGALTSADMAKIRELQDAEVRAEKLLRAHLSPAQLRSWDQLDYFTVTVKRGWRRAHRYRITASGGVGRLLSADHLHMYCIGPRDPVWYPNADRALMFKLMLESNEAEFLRLARPKLWSY